MDIKYCFLKICQKVLSQPIVRSSRLSKKSAIWNDCLIINSEINDYTYVSDHTSIYYTKIGKFCSIASHCTIGGAAHPVDFISTSPVFLEGRNALKTNFAKLHYKPYRETVIGNDVWIGAKCCIKGGIKIGDGAIIGMGSVLLKDVGPYEIWAGNPAHFIRKRFDDDTILELLKVEWWHFNEEEIRRLSVSFNDSRAFLKEIHDITAGRPDGKI